MAYQPVGASEHAADMMTFLMTDPALRLTREQAAGFVGVLQSESGRHINTSAVNKAGSGAFGAAQWLGSRSAALRSFAARMGKDPSDWEVQKQFIKSELLGPEAAALRMLRGATNVKEAANAGFAYERSDRPDYTKGQGAANATALLNLEAAPVTGAAGGRIPTTGYDPNTEAFNVAFGPGSTTGIPPQADLGIARPPPTAAFGVDMGGTTGDRNPGSYHLPSNPEMPGSFTNRTGLGPLMRTVASPGFNGAPFTTTEDRASRAGRPVYAGNGPGRSPTGQIVTTPRGFQPSTSEFTPTPRGSVSPSQVTTAFDNTGRASTSGGPPSPTGTPAPGVSGSTLNSRGVGSGGAYVGSGGTTFTPHGASFTDFVHAYAPEIASVPGYDVNAGAPLPSGDTVTGKPLQATNSVDPASAGTIPQIMQVATNPFIGTVGFDQLPGEIPAVPTAPPPLPAPPPVAKPTVTTKRVTTTAPRTTGGGHTVSGPRTRSNPSLNPSIAALQGRPVKGSGSYATGTYGRGEVTPVEGRQYVTGAGSYGSTPGQWTTYTTSGGGTITSFFPSNPATPPSTFYG